MKEGRGKDPELFSILSDSSPVGIFVVQQGKFQYTNREFQKQTGYGKAELLGMNSLALVLPEDMDTVRTNAINMLKGADASQYEYRLVRKDGSISCILERVVSIRYRGERAAFGYFIDITERKQTETMLHRALDETQRGRLLLLALSQASHSVQRVITTNEIFETVLNEVAKIGHHATILALTDNRECLTILHSTMRPIQALGAERPTGDTWSPAPFPLVKGGYHHRVIIEQESVFLDNFSEMIAATMPESERVWAIRAAELLGIRQVIGVPLVVDGQIYGMLDVQGTGLAEADVPAVRVFGNQIAIAIEKARLIQKVQQLAITDDLTGIYNRRYFYELLALEARRLERYGRPLSLVMVDVDNFKSVNDSCGHLIGDEVLRSLALISLAQVRGTDYVARYGGDEFTIIMPETGKEDAMVAAERLRQAVENHDVKIGDYRIRWTISLGVATRSTGGDQISDDLIGTADEALYEAKQGGRNRVCFRAATSNNG